MNLQLKMAIVARRESQTTVAKKAGVSESRLSRIVHGHSDATMEEKRALARVLRSKVGKLFPAGASAEQQT